MASGTSSFTTPVGRAMNDNEDLFCVGLGDRDVFWISDEEKEIQTRLMVCARMKDAVHWGVVTSLIGKMAQEKPVVGSSPGLSVGLS